MNLQGVIAPSPETPVRAGSPRGVARALDAQLITPCVRANRSPVRTPSPGTSTPSTRVPACWPSFPVIASVGTTTGASADHHEGKPNSATP